MLPEFSDLFKRLFRLVHSFFATLLLEFKMLTIICSPGGDGLTFYTLHIPAQIRPEITRWMIADIVSRAAIELYKI